MLKSTEKENKFLKIVYAKVRKEGKEELVPLKLYADGKLELNK
jgi:hypothetical protein